MQPLLLAQNARMPSLQDMVVTATRTEQPLSDLVADVSIVDRETIEASREVGRRLYPLRLLDAAAP